MFLPVYRFATDRWLKKSGACFDEFNMDGWISIHPFVLSLSKDSDGIPTVHEPRKFWRLLLSS
jgi:hypothetical protein